MRPHAASCGLGAAWERPAEGARPPPTVTGDEHYQAPAAAVGAAEELGRRALGALPHRRAPELSDERPRPGRRRNVRRPPRRASSSTALSRASAIAAARTRITSATCSSVGSGVEDAVDQATVTGRVPDASA